MNKQKGTGTNIESLMDLLESKDGMARQQAREALVDLGKLAVSSLVNALQSSKTNQVRWEAAKALGGFFDARAIPPLVKALEDSDADVAWLAGDALIKYKKDAWQALLQALIKSRSDSVLLRKGAHHVLVNQKEDGFNDLLTTLIKALEPSSAPESSTIAASDLLKRTNAKS